jgi:carbamoyltransferase
VLRTQPLIRVLSRALRVAKILGLSAFYHDSAAALMVDGELVAAAQEERFTRQKHDHNFPKQAVDYCLREADLDAADLDYVVFYDKPLLKFARLLETYLAFSPQGLRSFLMAMPLWLKTKLHLPKEIRKSLEGRFKGRIVFIGHHESHAASAFFPSPYDEAAILTMDGVGEWDTASIGHGKGNRIELLKTLKFPHSLGLLYSAFTYSPVSKSIPVNTNSWVSHLMGSRSTWTSSSTNSSTLSPMGRWQ